MDKFKERNMRKIMESDLFIYDICGRNEASYSPATVTTFRDCGLMVTDDFWKSLTPKLKEDAIEFHKMHHANNHKEGTVYPSYTLSAIIKGGIGLCIVCSTNCRKGQMLASEDDIFICSSSNYTQIIARIEISASTYGILKSITGSICCSCQGPKLLPELMDSSGTYCTHIQYAVAKGGIVPGNKAFKVNPKLRKLQLD